MLLLKNYKKIIFQGEIMDKKECIDIFYKKIKMDKKECIDIVYKKIKKEFNLLDSDVCDIIYITTMSMKSNIFTPDELYHECATFCKRIGL